MIKSIEEVQTNYDVICLHDYIRKQLYTKRITKEEFNEKLIKIREKILEFQKGK